MLIVSGLRGVASCRVLLTSIQPLLISGAEQVPVSQPKKKYYFSPVSITLIIYLNIYCFLDLFLIEKPVTTTL